MTPTTTVEALTEVILSECRRDELTPVDFGDAEQIARAICEQFSVVPRGDELDAMAEQLAVAAGVRWEKVSEPGPGYDPAFDSDSRAYWRRLARAALLFDRKP
ncbi:hypothetical protein [Sphingomonas sp. SAFR-052]|uniref:hypothetical protein n=1 Tax=Sphingomonas sp. SAFR-052 TaxID=3436867 RepID=UPI003F818AD5